MPTARRENLIVSSNEYHKNRQEVIIAAITSNIDRVLFSDTKVFQWKEAGLKYPSLVTGILQTIKGDMISVKLGRLVKNDFKNVQKNLEKVLHFKEGVLQ